MASGLYLHYMPTSNKKDARLIWVKRRLQRLISVYTCQIATLLDWSISLTSMYDNQSEVDFVGNF